MVAVETKPGILSNSCSQELILGGVGRKLDPFSIYNKRRNKMSYNFSKGSQVIGDLKAADDAQRNTLIDFGEDQIDFQTSGSARLQVINTGVRVLNGNLSFEDVIMAELSIPGIDLQTDTNAYRFTCPYSLELTELGLTVDQHTTSGNITVEVTNPDDGTLITATIPGTDDFVQVTTVTSGSRSQGDNITFEITATPANAQGLRANLYFKRTL